MLIGVYQNENKPEEALPILQAFTTRYLQNFLFRLEMASVLTQLNRQADAVAAFEALVKEAGTNSPAAKSMDLIRFQYAEALAKQQAYEKAATQFLSVTKEPNAEAGLVTMALLRAGQVFDLSNKRDEALTQYKAVVMRPNIYDSRDQAQKGLKQPFKKA